MNLRNPQPPAELNCWTGNYCASCSPIGRPCGELGEECCRCGQPIRMTPLETAEYRAAVAARRGHP